MRSSISPTVPLSITDLVLLFVATATWGQGIRELQPGTVIDTDQGRGFLMGPNGIDTVQLRSGTLLWHSDDALKPIALQDGLLVAQAPAQAFGRLELLALDAESGARLRAASIALPDDVFAHAKDTLGSSFALWRMETGAFSNELQIAWRYEHRIVQGMAPTGDGSDDPPSPTVRTGAFRLDPRTGAYTAIAGPERRTPERGLVAEEARIPGARGRQFLESRGSHVLASDKVADASDWNQYRWTVYTDQGEPLGVFSTFVSFAPFVVQDALLLFVTPPFTRVEGGEPVSSGPSLRAVELTNGVEQWSWLLEDARYRGSFPP